MVGEVVKANGVRVNAGVFLGVGNECMGGVGVSRLAGAACVLIDDIPTY